MDKIFIRDLKINTIIGTFSKEREKKQNLVFNIELCCNLHKAGKTDNLNDTVNYELVKEKILSLIEKSRFYLLEKAAEAVADICLKTPGVKSVKVTVDKPGALRSAESVAVEIERP